MITKPHFDQNSAKKRKESESKFQGKYLFLTLPHFEVNQVQISRLKTQVFEAIRARELPYLVHLGVVRETHKDGSYHLHVYVQYRGRRTLSPKHFDYLPKHPHVKVVRGLKAVLNYLTKEDSTPLFTQGFSPLYQVNKLRIEREPFALLAQEMRKDPLNFKVWQWIVANNLSVAASRGNWSKAINQLKRQQQVEANNILRSRVGMKEITRELIKATLTSKELELYDSWEGYQRIIDLLNDIPRYGFHRSHKRRNLLLVGRPNTGKTTLARKIRQYVAVYSFGVDNWFPRYQNWVYPMILWNQFYLRAMPYGQLLNILEGEATDLPFKGGSVLKKDNQLILITSNMTLEQHICSRFRQQYARDLARANLSVRIEQILIPEDKDLFLLLPLIQGATDVTYTGS